MAQEPINRTRARFWFAVIAIIIFLIFLYFYAPFEAFLLAGVKNVHFSNVVFWFASVIGILVYIAAHWQSFKRNILRHVSEPNADDLVFDTLQSAILVAMIFFAGGTLQAVAQLAVHLTEDGEIVNATFGNGLLTIGLFFVFVVLFFLLHYLIRAFRTGWRTRRHPPRVSSSN